MRLGVAVLALVFASTALPAVATETALCTNGDSASISVLLGSAEVIAPVRVDASVNDKNWSTDANTPASHLVKVGQAYEDDKQMLIDLTDANVGNVIIKLRLFGADGADGLVGGGTLWVKDAGAYAVTCTGL